MYFVCECGIKFDEEQNGARDHVLERHLDLVEGRFNDFLDEAIAEDEIVEDEEVYEDAVEDVVDELLDMFEGEYA